MSAKSSGIGTTKIALASATNLLHGVRFATDRGRPLTTEAIIAWHRLGIDDEKASRLFRALRQKVRQAWGYRDRTRDLGLGTFDDVVSHENPDGQRNTHWMVRVPPEFRGEFTRLVDRFLCKLADIEEPGRALLVRPVAAPGTLAKYLTKGVDPAFGRYFRIDAVDQGFIGGRGRTFVSRSLSRATRQREGWVRKRRPKDQLIWR